jgi:hypothetical protein
MNIDQAFRTTLRERYLLLSPEEVRAAERGRQGRLSHGDQDCYAIVDAFRNFRCHADAFQLATEELGDFVGAGQTICVVDLGAGAGNVAAALCERWNAAGKLIYIGVEPHAMMRRLAIQFLRELEPAWLDFAMVEDCRGLSIPEADRYLVTLNYVVHQPGIVAEDLRAWAALLAGLQARGPTSLVSVTARSISPGLEKIDCTADLVREMAMAGLTFDLHSTTRRMDRRMPGEDGNGWVVQPARGDDWHNVRIERYVLSSAIQRQQDQ